MGMQKLWMVLSVVVATSLPFTVSGAGPAYVAVPLGTLGGVTTYGTAINASGQVAGFADTDSTGALHRHAFLYSGTLRDLGVIPGGNQSFGYGINDLGQVVGSSNTSAAAQQRAVLFSAGSVISLDAALGGSAGRANAIDNAGNIVGAKLQPDASTTSRPFLLRAGSSVATDLGTFGGGFGQANAINVFGQVAGFSSIATQDQRAFRYDAASGLVNLGTLGGLSSVGNGIDPLGRVVGWSNTSGSAGPHAFLHDGTTMFDLGTLGGSISRANAINSSGEIVGESTDAQGTQRAFLYFAGTMIDLNTVTTGLNGATLTTATAVNDSGQIVAMSCPVSALTCPQAYRLDPVGATKQLAIEYRHAGFDHYFVTAIPDEIAKLDNGTFAGWTRTGEFFNVWSADQVGTSPVCRFFSTSFAPKSSHFYTPSASECATVQRNPNWQFEARVFNIATPDGQGNCPAGTQPIYRLYNNGMGAAPNHRYTTSLATRATMIAQGWIPEGYGPNAVGMCAPL